MTPFFVQNDEVFTNTMSFFSQYSFWMKKNVNDDVRAKGWEPEKKEPENVFDTFQSIFQRNKLFSNIKYNST